MPNISGLDHIVLNVADVERSLAFYRDVLNLPAERVEAWRRGELRFPSVRVNGGTIIDLVHAPAEPVVDNTIAPAATRTLTARRRAIRIRSRIDRL